MSIGLNFLVAQHTVKIKGSFYRCRLFWKDFLAAWPFVSSVVNEGYLAAFYPSTSHLFSSEQSFSIPKLQYSYPVFVETGILELLEKRLISEVYSPPHCINPLSVAQEKKLRLVLDLREVNRYLGKCSFHYEVLRSLAEVLEQRFLFFTLDLKSGYHNVDIFPPHQQFLGFCMVICRLHTVLLFLSPPVQT